MSSLRRASSCIAAGQPKLCEWIMIRRNRAEVHCIYVYMCIYIRVRICAYACMSLCYFVCPLNTCTQPVLFCFCEFSMSHEPKVLRKILARELLSEPSLRKNFRRFPSTLNHIECQGGVFPQSYFSNDWGLWALEDIPVFNRFLSVTAGSRTEAPVTKTWNSTNKTKFLNSRVANEPPHLPKCCSCWLREQKRLQ